MSETLERKATTAPVKQDQAVSARQEQAPAISNGILNVIARAAADPSVDVDKMHELLKLQDSIMKRQAEAEFNQAMADATGEIQRVAKMGKVDTGKGKYSFARWEDMDRMLRPVMQKFGFSLSFDAQERQGGGLMITGTIRHRSGHSQTASMPLPVDEGPGRNKLQAMGSTLSYGKRYCAEMLFNIVRENADDDGVQGFVRTVDAAQAKAIQDMVAEIGMPLADVLRHFGANSIQELPANQFARIVNSLNKRRQTGAQAK